MAVILHWIIHSNLVQYHLHLHKLQVLTFHFDVITSQLAGFTQTVQEITKKVQNRVIYCHLKTRLGLSANQNAG